LQHLQLTRHKKETVDTSHWVFFFERDEQRSLVWGENVEAPEGNLENSLLFCTAPLEVGRRDDVWKKKKEGRKRKHQGVSEKKLQKANRSKTQAGILSGKADTKKKRKPSKCQGKNRKATKYPIKHKKNGKERRKLRGIPERTSKLEAAACE